MPVMLAASIFAPEWYSEYGGVANGAVTAMKVLAPCASPGVGRHSSRICDRTDAGTACWPSG
jgi:hypothetical protein